jgi:hypothetical protein
MRALAALGLLLLAVPLRAQVNCTANPSQCSIGAQSIRITVDPVVSLAILPATTALTAPTAAHFNAGFAPTAGPTLTVRANSDWSLAISAATAVWSATDTESVPARTDKPASNLRWATSPGGPFTPLSTSAVNLVTGSATGGTATTIHFQTDWAWALDTPGSYSLQLVLTITAS